MEAEETIGDDGGQKYANSQFSNQNRQAADPRLITFHTQVVHVDLHFS